MRRGGREGGGKGEKRSRYRRFKVIILIDGSNKRSVGKVESPNASKFKDHQRFMCYSNPRRTQHIQQTNQGEKIPTHSSSHCAHQRHRMCQKRLHNNDFFPVKMDKSTVGVQFYHLTKSSSTPDHHQQANLVKFNPTNVRTDKIHLAQSIPTLKRRVNDQSVSGKKTILLF